MVESVLLLLAAQQVNGVQTQPEDIAVALQLVDEWGRGFVAETDYLYEADNTESFAEARARPRRGGAMHSSACVG